MYGKAAHIKTIAQSENNREWENNQTPEETFRQGKSSSNVKISWYSTSEPQSLASNSHTKTQAEQKQRRCVALTFEIRSVKAKITKEHF